MWRALQSIPRHRGAIGAAMAPRRFLRHNQRRTEDRQRLQLSNSFQLARRAGDRNSALDALRSIRSNGFSLKSNEVLDMMVLCAKDSAVDDAVDLLRSVKNLESGGHVRVLNTQIWNAVLLAVDSIHDPDHAWELFRELQEDDKCQPDELSHHIVMSTAIRTGQWQLALKLLGLLRQDGSLRVQPFSYFLAVTGVAIVGELKMLKSLLAQSVKDEVPLEMEMLDEAVVFAQEAEQPEAVEILQTFAEKHRTLIEERDKMRKEHTSKTFDVNQVQEQMQGGRRAQRQPDNPLENILRAAEEARDHGLVNTAGNRESASKIAEQEGLDEDVDNGPTMTEDELAALLEDAAASKEELSKIEQMNEEEFEEYMKKTYPQGEGGGTHPELDDLEKEMLRMDKEMEKWKGDMPNLDAAEGLLPKIPKRK